MMLKDWDLTLSELQTEVALFYERKGFDASVQTLLLGVMEELGELATAALLTQCDDFKPSTRKLQEFDAISDMSEEIGDLITYLLAVCNKLGIDPHFKFLER